MTDANDLLMGSGNPTAKFAAIGAIVTGTLIGEPEARQQKDYRTGVLETWKDGSPKMMIVVNLATTERDPARPDDDGTRTLYIQGKNLTDAIRIAVRAAGANGLHTGGTLWVQYTGNGPQPDPKLDPPKLFTAKYAQPAVSFDGVGGPVQQQQIPIQQQPVQQQIPQAQSATVATITQQPVIATDGTQLPTGVDQATWDRLTPAQRATVLAASNQPPF